VEVAVGCFGGNETPSGLSLRDQDHSAGLRCRPCSVNTEHRSLPLPSRTDSKVPLQALILADSVVCSQTPRNTIVYWRFSGRHASGPELFAAVPGLLTAAEPW
jgi:hypothetical protein